MDNIVRNWLENAIVNGWDWEQVRLAGQSTEEELKHFLKGAPNYIFGWPITAIEDWFSAVEEFKRKKEEISKLSDDRGASCIGDESNDLHPSTEEDSAWQTYRRKLLEEKDFSETAVELMEKINGAILRRLSRNTVETGAVKGLVVGNVQSGKTANMAALMAMAADNGWNMFIILSGMMNNLKNQTLNRLTDDLYGSRFTWQSISNPEVRNQDIKLLRLNLNPESQMRYVTVGIKNSTRLKNLLNWLNYDQTAKEKLRILIIDDESDQASIDTNTEGSRTAINQLIGNLLNNRDSKHQPTGASAEAINYVGFTATPYANVLNEGPSTDSLYPADFITSLPVSDEYFGPQQIFGCERGDADSVFYSGLNIVREISAAEEERITDLHNGSSSEIPDALIKSICWFMCGVASMRTSEYKKSISMLVHTSRNTEHHDRIKNAIIQWFATTPKSEKMELCRAIWNEETARFTLEDFQHGYPSYATSRGGANINPLQSFEDIELEVEHLIDTGLRSIEVNNENTRNIYSTGIHLCVDNSAANDADDVQKRLIYPKTDEMPNVAPAFLVIGGNTLSRGLTIEGLISTFFIRPVNCADTLMQMGRWFGYRRDYELLPRIWMPDDTKADFVYMAEMDQSLRDEIKCLEDLGVRPDQVGPKFKVSPNRIALVARNKSQSMRNAECDFTGHNWETTVLSNKLKDVNANLVLTRTFVDSLGDPTLIEGNPRSNSNHVWRGVKWSDIRFYLEKFKYSKKLKSYQNLEAFLEWFDQMEEQGIYEDWNVILAGIQRDESGSWSTGGVTVNKVQRTEVVADRKEGDETMNIRSVRSFNDLLSDIDINDDQTREMVRLSDKKHNQIELNSLREKVGLGKTPQLVLYIIDKDSKPKKEDAKTRFPLNAKADVVAFSINIPGFRVPDPLRSVTINLDPVEEYSEED